MFLPVGDLDDRQIELAIESAKDMIENGYEPSGLDWESRLQALLLEQQDRAYATYIKGGKLAPT